MTQYLVFTDSRILYAKKTLWRGITKIIPILYSDVYSVIANPQKKNVYKYVMGYTKDATDSKILVRLKNGEFMEFYTRNHAFVAAVVERIDLLHK